MSRRIAKCHARGCGEIRVFVVIQVVCDAVLLDKVIFYYHYSNKVNQLTDWSILKFLHVSLLLARWIPDPL